MADQATPKNQLPVVRKNPKAVSPIYTNDMSVTFSDREIFVTFSLIEPPLFANEDEFRNTNQIDATAVAKIVMTPEFAEIAVKALADLLDKYKNRE